MSLDTTDTGFESLRGTMLTEAGWAGLHEFSAFQPDFLVVEKAFTPECPEIIDKVGSHFNEAAPEEIRQVTDLVTFLGSISRQGINHPLYVQGFWDEAQPGIEPHPDYKQGHTFLGMFDIEGSPELKLYNSRTSRPQVWRTGSRTISHSLNISHEDPVAVPLLDNQLIIINGRAVRASLHIGEKVTDGRASLPHAVELGPGDRRARLMVYAGAFKPVRHSYLPGTDLSFPVGYRPKSGL